MEKSQYKLCMETLRCLSDAGVLDELLLIGSWCVPFYESYFSGITYLTEIRTRDIDFLVPVPRHIKVERNIPELLKSAGFIVSFTGSQGFMKLEHPELVVEFLVPELGRGTDRPVLLAKLGVNAVALRFLNFLADNIIRVKVEDFYVRLPHPANFALHKLIIFQRRRNIDKSVKDRETALRILRALIEKGDLKTLKRILDSVPVKWQNKMKEGLLKAKADDILSALNLNV